MDARVFVQHFACCLMISSFSFQTADVVAQYNTRELMDMSLQDLMNLKIFSVSRRPEKLAESASAIQVITADQIRRSGATSIPEALRLATNLSVAQQNSHEWVISARGFSSDVGNKLLVLIDGRTVYTPLFSGVFWDRQNYLLEDIERIEVISGPGGTLWGANAVNGVINIITRSANQTQGLFVEAGGGTALNHIGGARYGGWLNEHTSYRVYGQHFDRDDETLSNGDRGNDAWEMQQSGFRTDSRLGGQDSLTVQGDYYRNTSSLLHGEESETEGANMLGRWTHKLSKTSNTILQLYYDKTKLVLPVPNLVVNNMEFAPAGVFKDTLETFDLDFQQEFAPFRNQIVVWGVGYRYTRDDVGNAPSLAFYPEHLEQELWSAFIQDEIALIGEKVRMAIGTKVEKNEYTDYEWEPNIRLQWRMTQDHQVWASASRAVRMPSRIDRHIAQPSRDYLVILAGGPDFESEYVNAYELGYRGKLGARAAISVALFYNEYRDVRSTNLTPATILPFFFENNLEAETRGVELSADIEILRWFRMKVGYTYLHEDVSVKKGEYDFNNALNETADPEHQVSLRSSFDIGRDVELDIGYRWVDRLPTNNAGVLTYVPLYSELDIRIGWMPMPSLEFSLVGQNLLHDHHHEFGVPGDFQQEVGRNVYGKVQWRY